MSSYKHKTGTFKGKGDVELFFQEWTVPSPQAVLLAVHGLGEHSGRYENLIEALAGSGVSIYAFDNRGFGRSAGKRGCVSSFSDYVDDQQIFVDMVKSNNSGVPLFMLGHSLGGLITFRYALEHGRGISGILLSSPAFVFIGKAESWKRALGRLMSLLKPDFSLGTGDGFAGLTHDLEYIESCKNDPLLHDKISARLYTEFMKTSADCMSRAFELSSPMLIFHGNADPIIDYKGSQTIFERVSSHDKEIRIFDGLYHKTMNEIPDERQKVFDLITAWIKKHSGKPSSEKAVNAAAKKSASKKAVKAAPKKPASNKTVKAAAKKSASKKAVSKKAGSAKKTVTKGRLPKTQAKK